MPLGQLRTCVECEKEFQLLPDKPGRINVCPACSVPENERYLSERDRSRQQLDALGYEPAGLPIISEEFEDE